MGEIIEGLGDQARRRAKELLEGGHYFWIDVVSDGEAPEVLAKELRIDDRALEALLDFDPDASPSRRFHIDGKHVAFAMSCYVDTPEGESTGLPLLEGHERELVDVRVLVTGGYLLTIHEEPISLPDLLQIQEPGGRSEQYMVYAVLDAMVATAYDALNQAELVLEVTVGGRAPEQDIGGGTYRLLFRVLASHPEEVRSFYEDTVAPLVRYDDQYSTDLVGTLGSYLENNCNMNATASAIHAHRHTVGYRLERVKELTGLDPSGSEDRERLSLGLKAYRIIEPSLPR